jgi:hypothetical protein
VADESILSAAPRAFADVLVPSKDRIEAGFRWMASVRDVWHRNTERLVEAVPLLPLRRSVVEMTRHIGLRRLARLRGRLASVSAPAARVGTREGSSALRTHHSRSREPARVSARSIAWAASRPSAIAQTISDAPRVASPAA